MDLSYWGFQRWPFERTFAQDRFYSSQIHEEALARLLFLVEEHRRMGLLSGSAGTGKTYLLRLLHERAERLGRLTVRCDATGLSGIELATQIAIACHVPVAIDDSPLRVWHGIGERFAALTLVQQSALVIVDHFDSTEHGCQQALCRLRQTADAAGTKLTMVLATRERAVPSLLQDHIELGIEVVPWTADETAQFLRFCLARANCKEMLFTDEAVSAVFEATCGVPNAIVMLCSLALLAAKGQDETVVTSECVVACAGELPRRSVDQGSGHRTVGTRSMAGTAAR